MSTWLFQSTPESYDVASALKVLPTHTWLVSHYKTQMHKGDKVFLWETGKDAGIVAVATVLTEPAMMPIDPGEERFTRENEKFSGTQLRVRLQIDRVLDPRLSKVAIISDPVLAKLPNIRFARGTNFPLTPDQESALNAAIDSLNDNAAVEAEPEPAGLTAEEFDVLARHRTSIPWDEVAAQDRAIIQGLRAKLSDYATALSRRLSTKTPLHPFVSILNPSGRVGQAYWCCVYPASVSNKSYGFQLAVIVNHDSVEVGFGVGRGTGGNAHQQVALRTELARAKERLKSLRDSSTLRTVARQAGSVGLVPRSDWRGDPKAQPLAAVEDWVDHASGPQGNGAAISAFWPKDDVMKIGHSFFPRILQELDVFSPIVDAIYSSAPPAPPSAPPSPRLTLEQLAAITLWDPAKLEEVAESLRKTQVVLAGPPGTGKTWVAKHLARYVADGNDERVRIVQFHPSYTYEQFVEGLRPVIKSGAVQFEPVEGLVLHLASQARKATGPFVLIIDEMNRANLPRVFGELMYLFEYRGEEIQLQYTDKFSLPDNLRFIGTMNTADRSIRSIDIALRRRFDVFECPPDMTILERWYSTTNRNSIPDLIDGLTKLNEELTERIDRHHTIGHTFFMAPEINVSLLRHIWDHKVGPLLEEYFFDDPETAKSVDIGNYWADARES